MAPFWAGEVEILRRDPRDSHHSRYGTLQGCHPLATSVGAGRAVLQVLQHEGGSQTARSISHRVCTRGPGPDLEKCVCGYLAARRRSSASSACSLAILHDNSLPRACRKPCVSSTGFPLCETKAALPFQ